MTRYVRSSFGALLMLSLLSIEACTPSAVRVGPALPLPSGPASNACEQRGFYEAAPTRFEAEGATSGVLTITHYHRIYEGLGVYRPSNPEPEKLRDVWPQLNEPRLQQLHEQRTLPVDRANRDSNLFALAGLVGLFGGVSTAAAIQSSHRDAATVVGFSGFALGIAGLIGALITQPSGFDQLQADARSRLFLSGEDDVDAVKRGLDRNNQQVRAQCSR